MKIAATVCFVLATLGYLVAVNNVFLAGGANRPDRPENLISYAVGSFLLPTVFLILGLKLRTKSKQSGDES